ncbi:MAG: methyltransferase domain-containing protein [Planctomycetota bacterium]
MKPLAPPRSPELHALMSAVARGAVVGDEQLDEIFPDELRALSAVHWTPFAVAVRALELLDVGEGQRVLDVGSGAGKLCLLGALRTKAEFVGVEEKPELVALSRALAHEYGAARASFFEGSAEDVDWASFDALYFFNPFGEHSLGAEDRFHRLVRLARKKLGAVRHGTRVVTFDGLGGPMPSGYRFVTAEAWQGGMLKCWVRDEQGDSV